jgi:hypothetical protein
MVQGMGETHVDSEVGMQNLDLEKVRLEIASVSSIFLPFHMPFPMQFNPIKLSKYLNIHPSNSTRAKKRPRFIPII